MNRESSYFRKWMRLSLAAFLFVGVVFCPRIHADTVWPEQQWEQASPESQGMSGEKLDAAAHYALSAGGGSGCIIRGGYLVKEWGDPQ
ncbi:MAG: hypothetical protein IH892_19820, partial [Planctomycetes bacterium]|nr:hypothetical protein [Planctomycetota bacterium]